MPALGAPGVCATPRCPRKMPSASQIPLALELTCMQWARLAVGGGGGGWQMVWRPTGNHQW